MLGKGIIESDGFLLQRDWYWTVTQSSCNLLSLTSRDRNGLVPVGSGRWWKPGSEGSCTSTRHDARSGRGNVCLALWPPICCAAPLARRKHVSKQLKHVMTQKIEARQPPGCYLLLSANTLVTGDIANIRVPVWERAVRCCLIGLIPNSEKQQTHVSVLALSNWSHIYS